MRTFRDTRACSNYTRVSLNVRLFATALRLNRFSVNLGGALVSHFGCSFYLRFIFSSVSFCLDFGLRKNYCPGSMNFYRIVGHNPLNSRLDFEWPWSKVKIPRGQKVKLVFANNSIQNYRTYRSCTFYSDECYYLSFCFYFDFAFAVDCSISCVGVLRLSCFASSRTSNGCSADTSKSTRTAAEHLGYSLSVNWLWLPQFGGLFKCNVPDTLTFK